MTEFLTFLSCPYCKLSLEEIQTGLAVFMWQEISKSTCSVAHLWTLSNVLILRTTGTHCHVVIIPLMRSFEIQVCDLKNASLHLRCASLVGMWVSLITGVELGLSLLCSKSFLFFSAAIPLNLAYFAH